jgi:hypothetical protein
MSKTEPCPVPDPYTALTTSLRRRLKSVYGTIWSNPRWPRFSGDMPIQIAPQLQIEHGPGWSAGVDDLGLKAIVLYNRTGEYRGNF